MGRVNTVFKQKLGKQVGCLMAFLWELTEEEKAQNFNSKAREQGAPIFISPIRAESFQGKKAVPPSGGWSHIHQALPPWALEKHFHWKQLSLRISIAGCSPRRTQIACTKFIDHRALQSFNSRRNRIELPFLPLFFLSFIFYYFLIYFPTFSNSFFKVFIVFLSFLYILFIYMVLI